MRLQLNLVENNNTVANKILIALLDPVTEYMNDIIRKIKIELPSIVSRSIFNTQEYVSLTSGQLKFELGIPNPEQKITSLLNIWTSNIEYNYIPPRVIAGQIKSSFSIGLIKSDFSDVLGTDYAIVRDSSGYQLPWLQWLLLDGNVPLVSNHQVIMGPSSRSRTGYAIMRKSSQNWKVPSQFSGTLSDNWITRALENSSDEIDALIEKAMTP